MMDIYQKAARLCVPDGVTLAEYALLCAIAFMGGWSLAIAI